MSYITTLTVQVSVVYICELTPVKICFRLRLQNLFPCVISHMVLRVEYRVLTFQYIFKIKKKTTRMPDHNLKKFYVKCTELFSKLKKKLCIIENWKLKWLGCVGWGLGVILCCSFFGVGARVSITGYKIKWKKTG